MKSKQHSISTHKKVRYFRMDVDNVLGVASMVQRGSIARCTNVIAGSHKIFHEKNIISITRIWTVSVYGHAQKRTNYRLICNNWLQSVVFSLKAIFTFFYIYLFYSVKI